MTSAQKLVESYPFLSKKIDWRSPIVWQYVPKKIRWAFSKKLNIPEDHFSEAFQFFHFCAVPYDWEDKLYEVWPNLRYNSRKVNEKVFAKLMLEHFTKGYYDGYHNFESYLKEQSKVFYNDDIKAYHIAMISSKRPKLSFFDNHEFTLLSSGENGLGTNQKILPQLNDSILYSEGLTAGRFYAAWKIILAAPSIFEHYFSEIRSPKKFTDFQKPNKSAQILMLFAKGVAQPLMKQMSARKVAIHFNFKSSDWQLFKDTMTGRKSRKNLYNHRSLMIYVKDELKDSILNAEFEAAYQKLLKDF